MQERTGLVTFKGNPLTLVGNAVGPGDEAPEFVALDTSLAEVRFSSFRGKVCVLSAVPSLDTPVCDTQTRRVERVRTLSDHRDASFGTAYGVLIKELRLLARAVFVVDPDGSLWSILTAGCNTLRSYGR